MIVNYLDYQFEELDDADEVWVYKNGKRIMHFLLSSRIPEKDLVRDMKEVLRLITA